MNKFEFECPQCHRLLDFRDDTGLDMFCSTECRKAYLDIGGCHRCGAPYDNREGWQTAKYEWCLDNTSICPDCLALFSEIKNRLERIGLEKVLLEKQLFKNPVLSIDKRDGDYYLHSFEVDSVSFSEFKKMIEQYEAEEVDEKLRNNEKIYKKLMELEDKKAYLIRLRQIRINR